MEHLYSIFLSQLEMWLCSIQWPNFIVISLKIGEKSKLYADTKFSKVILGTVSDSDEHQRIKIPKVQKISSISHNKAGRDLSNQYYTDAPDILILPLEIQITSSSMRGYNFYFLSFCYRSWLLRALLVIFVWFTRSQG